MKTQLSKKSFSMIELKKETEELKKPAELGLWSCQQLVSELGSESELGIGTAFKVLPGTCNDKVTEAVSVTKRGKVLLIDDDPVIGVLVRRVLEKEHEVKVFTSAKDALAYLVEGHRFDVILCDMMMPIMTGMDFYNELSVRIYEQAERIVFLTGGAFTTIASEFLERSSNLHIEKPFSLQGLRLLVNERVAGMTTNAKTAEAYL
jgi:CheY-like chemotaxis protein